MRFGVCTALALLMLTICAAAASANITNIYALDGLDGQPNNPIDGGVVADNAEIWAYVTSVSGGVICIHPQSDAPKSCDDDGAYSKAYVPPFFTGFVPVANGSLVPGDYMLVGEEINDGPVGAQSEGFTVAPCQDQSVGTGCAVPPIDKSQGFIAAANSLANNIKQMCSLVKTANQLYRAKAAYEAADQAVTVGTSGGGMNVAGVISLAQNPTVQSYVLDAKVPDKSKLPSQIPGALSTLAGGICSAANTIGNIAGKVNNQTTQATIQAWANDPPDPNYQQVGPPTFVDYSSILAWTDWGFGDGQDALDGVRAYSESSLTAFERYQGAQAANDPGWEHAQARAMGADLLGEAARLRRGAMFLHNTAAGMRATYPDPADRTVTQDDLNLVQGAIDRWRSTGFNAAETQSLQDVGLDTTAINWLLANLTIDDPGTATPEALDQSFDDTANAMSTLADEAETYGRTVAVAAGRDAPALAPDFSISQATTNPWQLDFQDLTPDVGDQLTVQWDFGDGSAPVYGGHVSHTYSGRGPYTVTETVSTDYGSATQTHQVNPGTADQPPTASFNANPMTAKAPFQAHFDASPSTDVDGTIVSYTWDFGDGTQATGESVDHTFQNAQTYAVTLTVTDDAGLSSSTSQLITGTSDAPPTASFNATPMSGAAPLQVHLDASPSTDTDGTIQSYSWDFGDGSAGATGQTVDHTFNDPSANGYTVTLTVTDDAGLTSTMTKTIDVYLGEQAPVAADDNTFANPGGVVDVLANDSDPNNDPMTVTSSTQPSNGHVTCSTLGACDYTAGDGFQGSDSFTYTVSDPGGMTSTATVNVSVSTPPSNTQPLPVDDSAETTLGSPVDVNVLANDSGAGTLTFQSVTQPSNGTVSCTPDGVCTYTPNAGFSGDDGFSYTISDDTAQTATALVTVSVLPADAAYSLKVDAGASPLQSGSDAQWGVGVLGRTLTPPSIGVSLSGPQSRLGASTQTARGWSATAGGGAQAGPDAVLGDEISVPITKPSATISQGTGGDGHVPILVGNRVFAFFHHSNPTAATCIDRRTNRLCPGYPVPVNVATDNIPGPGVVIGSKIYLRIGTGGYAQSSALAILCWDTSNAQPCGLDIVRRFSDPTYHYGSTPVLVDGKLWVALDDEKLYCIDPDTGTGCGSIPTGLINHPGGYSIRNHGSKVFVGEAGGDIACIDVSVNGPCAGWPTPVTLPGGAFGNVTDRLSPTGAVTGICDFGVNQARCWPDDNSSSTEVLDNTPGLPDMLATADEDAEIGNRTLFGIFGGGAACFDWSTLSRCTDGDYNSGGYITTDIAGQNLPSAYGVASDGGCAVALGDSGLVFTVDPKGFAPCEGAPLTRALDLRDQRCDNTVGSSYWESVSLGDTAAGELGRVMVTVRDAGSGQVLATKNLINGDLDLTGIDPSKHPAIRVSMSLVSTPNSKAWDDSIPPRLVVKWHQDPEQLCFRASTPPACPSDPISLQATLGALTQTDQVDLLSTNCPPPPPAQTDNTPPPSPPAPTPPAGPAASQLVLGCSKKPLVLEDVFMQGGRVQLLGVADKKFVGKKVQFVFAATKKVVATTTVGPDGGFTATAPLPPAKLRNSNNARYLAKIGNISSLNLKLVRRMLVTSLVAKGGKVTITGRVTLPLAPKAADREITLQRLVGCSRVEAVTTFQPKSDGSFSITVPAVAGQTAAVYRLLTKVLAQGGSKHLLSTFTLPRAVNFN